MPTDVPPGRTTPREPMLVEVIKAMLLMLDEGAPNVKQRMRELAEDALAAAHAAEIDRLRSAAPQGEPLTAEDREQIAEGIEHFIIGVVDPDPVVAAIWQPYIDKLRRRATAVDPPDTEADHAR